jgi:hypothetical protein
MLTNHYFSLFLIEKQKPDKKEKNKTKKCINDTADMGDRYVCSNSLELQVSAPQLPFPQECVI